jgi:hypothetical protein
MNPSLIETLGPSVLFLRSMRAVVYEDAIDFHYD